MGSSVLSNIDLILFFTLSNHLFLNSDHFAFKTREGNRGQSLRFKKTNI
jgi:hypothetical protein